jgi:hypothetical protein
VHIKFQEIKTGLASSLTYHLAESYSSYIKALKAHATSANDKTAIATLPTGSTNPVNKGSSIILSDPNARALGFAASPPGGFDSTIGLNMAEFNISRSSINPNKYDLIASSMHEMDEVLGINSALDNFNSGTPIPTTSVDPEDLYRYNSAGKRSFTTSASAVAGFSFDGGKTFLARFNQTKGGDFNDWYSPGGQSPQVQDASGTPGAIPTLGVELNVLDILGYTLAPGVNGGFKPDLAPAELKGWSSAIVITTVNGSITDSTSLKSSQTIYIDAAVINIGETKTTATETNTIVLDGKVIATATSPAGLLVGHAFSKIGLSLGKLSAGKHTITINVNTTGSVSEISTADNTFTRTFTVT